MLQKIYEQTMLSDYIKQLLKDTALPTNKLIFDDDWMYEGCTYQYKDRILYCTKSGRFTGISGTVNEEGFLTVHDHLEVSDTLRVTRLSENDGRKKLLEPVEQPLTVTDDVLHYQLYDEARFRLLHRIIIPENDYGNSFYFTSNKRYYDPITHRYLGEYLRLLNNEQNMNLMCLYNCYGGQVTQSFTVGLPQSTSSNGTGVIDEQESTQYKTYLVPIKFDKEYTIAMDCSFPVRIHPIFYRNGILKDSVSGEFLHSSITNSFVQKSSTQFIDPFVYKIDPNQCYTEYNKVKTSTYPRLHGLERYLMLCIQVPSSISSTLTVLEGNYASNSVTMISDISGIYSPQTNTSEFSNITSGNLSLLQDNDGLHHLFSDKLVEYLLRNTIDPRDTNSDNIERVQRAIGYQPEFLGMWDKGLQYQLYTGYMSLQKKHPELNYSDILGYVDSDVEKAIRKGYIAVG